jgi:Ser/Thr protein kinase RdoA (MazF antagonist)
VIEAARAALAAWGQGSVVRAVAERENIVYEVSVGGTRAALRLHRPGYQSRTAVASELWWCGALAATGFPCPTPLPTRDGTFVAAVGDRLASLVTWCPGAPLADPGPDHFRRLGALIAHLHDATDRLAGQRPPPAPRVRAPQAGAAYPDARNTADAPRPTPERKADGTPPFDARDRWDRTLPLGLRGEGNAAPPYRPGEGDGALPLQGRGVGDVAPPLPLPGGGSGRGSATAGPDAAGHPAPALPPWFQRPSWDADAFLSDAPRWGRFWDNPTLTTAESAALLTARDAARADLAAAPETDTGLIHGDILRENVLAAGDALWLIDFDDSGWGFHISDLGSALIQSWDSPALPGLAAALLDGYARRRDPGPDAPRRLTRALMLRGFASCGWILTRTAPDDPRRRGHADRAVALARLWISGASIA